ncbi:MAG: TonB-dependent receptor [Candidatus Aminicenantes bacterium]|nr:TonB-dependent receptor [Candidatus Aminicenantes bacterium]
MGLIFAASWLAASETGEIRGKVTDDTGQGLPGVEITAAGPALQGVRTVLSSRDGNFLLPLLPVGAYTLTFKLQGFETVIQEKVIVRLGLTTTLAVKMAASALHREITVTAEEPLIDRTSTDTSYRLSAADLERIPAQNRTVVDVTKYTPGVTGVRANTRRGTAAEGQPSFRGEGEEGNHWVVDGLSVSGVRFKNSGLRLNFDALEEVQIISDPFSPEFGAAYGGVVNMVTKSGSNAFHGSAGLIFDNKALQAARRPQLSIVSEPNAFSNANGFLNLGGPLVKDRLWFFLSGNTFRQTEETLAGSLDYLAVPAGRKTTGNNNVFAKLTFGPSPNHSLSLTAVFDKSFPQKGGTGLTEMYESRDTADRLLRLNYKGILDATTFVEAGFGGVWRKDFRHPDDGDLGRAMHFIEDLAQNINNSYGDVTDDERRLDAGIKLTKFFETDTFGSHEIAAGLEYYDFGSEFVVDFSGKDEDIFPGNGFDAGTKYFFDSRRGGKGTPTFFFEYGPFDFVNSARGIGLFVKDKAAFGRFTVMAGFRSQTQVCRDDANGVLWRWGLGDFLSPRFSLTADLTGDGRNVVKAAWGRFSDLVTTMPLGFFNTGAGLTFRTYRWQGGASPSEAEVRDPAAWQFENEQKLQAFEVADGLKPNFQTRFLLEYDRRLGPDWALKARFVRATSKDLLEILAVFDMATLYRFLYDNFEHKRRDYTGLEFELHGRIGRSLFLNASYSHALARGTNPGQSESGAWSQDEGSTNYLGLFGNHLYVPPLPELAAVKDWVDAQLGGLGGRGVGDEGWYGKLPYSADHNVKLNLAYSAPRGISAAAAFEYISGYYWEKLGYVPFFGGYYAFPEGRGSRKSPAHAYLDLSLEKSFTFGAASGTSPLRLAVRLDVFNALNSQRPISYVKENIPLFGTAWALQQPRQARVSALLKF